MEGTNKISLSFLMLMVTLLFSWNAFASHQNLNYPAKEADYTNALAQGTRLVFSKKDQNEFYIVANQEKPSANHRAAFAAHHHKHHQSLAFQKNKNHAHPGLHMMNYADLIEKDSKIYEANLIKKESKGIKADLIRKENKGNKSALALQSKKHHTHPLKRFVA